LPPASFTDAVGDLGNFKNGVDFVLIFFIRRRVRARR